jgi:hypothetical protein
MLKMELIPDVIPSVPEADSHTNHFIGCVQSFKVKTPVDPSIEATELISSS